MVSNEAKNYDFILPTKTCQRHKKQELQTSATSSTEVNHPGPFQ